MKYPSVDYEKKSLDTIENSTIKSIFTSDNLFLKLILIRSLRLSNLTPVFIRRPEWIVVPPILTVDMFVGPKRRTGGLSGSVE